MRSMPKAAVLPWLLLAACQPADTETGEAAPAAEMAEADEAAVRDALMGRIDGYEQAALAGDVEGMNDMWTEDARMFEPGMDMSGPEITAFYDEVFGGGARVTGIDIRTSEVFAHGDVAYSIGDYQETLVMSEGAEPMEVHANWFARWERGADAVWRIDRLMTAPVDAPEGMEEAGQ